MAVLSDSYLIGKVVEVNFMTSRVLLLSDLNSKIPVTVEPGGIQSILSGDGKNSGIIQYTKSKTSINSDSIIYTSGTGDLLKPGIPIGKISSDKNLQKLDFFSDFSQLRYIKDEASINHDSLVYTSGSGGLFKPGIPIGKINKSNNKNEVNFFIDFTQLRYVKVASYIEKEN